MRRLFLISLLTCCLGHKPTVSHVVDLVVMGQSLASADIRFGETIPVAELEGTDVVRWYASTWTPAQADAGAANSPGIGQWQAVLARGFIIHNGAQFVRFVDAVQSASSITAFIPGSVNYIAWATEVDASGARPKVFIWWQGADDYAMQPDTYEGHLESLWSQAKADAASLERMLIVEAFDWIDGVATHCGQDMWRVRMARGAFADANQDVTLLDLSHIPIGSDGCHLTWSANKQAAEAIRIAVLDLLDA